LIDRRRIELIDIGLPKHPYHHEGQSLPLSEAEELVERVSESAHRNAADGLAAIESEVSAQVVGIALRESPSLPATVADRLTNYRAQNVADSVLYREALADAASERGWSVHRYDKRRVVVAAAAALDRDDIDVVLRAVGRSVGPPWQQDHRIAVAAATVALDELGHTVTSLAPPE
jgi:hypothetical protein